MGPNGHPFCKNRYYCMLTTWNDAALIAALSGKEAERNRALQHLVQGTDWCAQVIRHVKANSGTEEDGEELFLDVLTILDRNVRNGDFEGRSSMKTYFMRIATFRWLKELAKRRPELSAQPLLDTDEGVQESVERAIIAAEHESVFAQVMTEVGLRCKRIFELAHLGYTSQEIAQEVGISDADQAKKEKSRCKKRLLQLLADRPELRNFFKE